MCILLFLYSENGSITVEHTRLQHYSLFVIKQTERQRERERENKGESKGRANYGLLSGTDVY